MLKKISKGAITMEEEQTTIMYNLSATYEDDGSSYKDFETAKAEYDELIKYDQRPRLIKQWLKPHPDVPNAWIVVKEQTLYTCR